MQYVYLIVERSCDADLIMGVFLTKEIAKHFMLKRFERVKELEIPERFNESYAFEDANNTLCLQMHASDGRTMLYTWDILERPLITEISV